MESTCLAQRTYQEIKCKCGLSAAHKGNHMADQNSKTSKQLCWNCKRVGDCKDVKPFEGELYD